MAFIEKYWNSFFIWMDTLKSAEKFAVWVLGIPFGAWVIYLAYSIIFVVLGSPVYCWLKKKGN